MASIIGYVGGVLTTIGGIPQIIRMINTQDTSSLSWGMLFLWTVGLSCNLIYGILIYKIPIFLSASASLIMTLIMIILKIKYDKKTDYESLDTI